MHFGLTEEQTQLKDIARRFLADAAVSATDIAHGTELGTDALWARIVEEQGWPAIPIIEEAGGFGFGWMDLAVVMEELGRALTPCPLLGTAIAAAAGVELEAIAGGTIATVAFGDGVRASGGDGEVLLTGQATALNPNAEVVVVEADGRLFHATPTMEETLPVLDVTRPLSRLGFEATPAVPLAADLDHVKAVAHALIAAEAVGSAEACLDTAVDYLKVRKQFGKLIGTFQSLQHMAADMLVQLESARSAAWYACWALDEGAPDGTLAAHTAKAMATDALFHCAGQNIQLHGGIGFTWEHDAHLYFKRALSSKALFGDPRDHREAVATHLLGAL